MKKLLLLICLVASSQSIIAQCDYCDTCWPRYPIKSTLFTTARSDYPLYFEGYNKTQLFITPMSYMRWDTMVIANSYDSISNLGYLHITYQNGETQEGKFSLELKSDSCDHKSYQYLQLIPDSTWRNESAEEKYVHTITWKNGVLEGPRLLIKDSVIIVQGNYVSNRQVGTWITTGNNDAKVICVYDSFGFERNSVAYWSYTSHYLKWEFHRKDGDFITCANENDTSLCQELGEHIRYDAVGIAKSKLTFYPNCSDTSVIYESFVQWFPNGAVRMEIRFVCGVAHMRTYYPDGKLKSEEFYRDCYIIGGEYFNGNKIGRHTFYKNNGEVERTENYD